MIMQRLLPPISVAQQTLNVDGRSYVAQPGTAIDVPDFDGVELQANGWVFVARSGPTSERPTPRADGTLGLTNAGPGDSYFDTDIGALIVCDGETWRSPVDGSAL